MMQTQASIIYDPKCTVCLRIKKLLELLDRTQALGFISLYDSERLADFPDLNLEDCHGKVHFIRSDFTIFKGAQAVEEILLVLTPHQVQPLMIKLLKLAFIQASIATGYEYLNAYRLRKRGACEVCR